MRFFAPALIFCGVVASSAQTPIVPHKMNFAGITLVVRDDARREIQKDVDALTQSPKYFNIKVERAKTYFPIIERVFAEERVPDDFKFLVLQESALIADAVSVSDAVGFWQFKDYTAREMGMRVDEEVDERMNIVSATRGAAKYIKQNNFMFNNWLYALQAYQMGAGGLKRMVGDDLDGSRHMEINTETYWYVKKFLANKVAFEEAVKGDPKIKITEQVMVHGGSLQAIADSVLLDLKGLMEFNKWVRKDGIPSDKPYTVILPARNLEPDFSWLTVQSTSTQRPAAVLIKTNSFPEGETLVNEIPVILAQQGESLAALAQRAGISLPQFLRFNEVSARHQVIAGTYYFLGKKKSKTDQDYHKVGNGENLWQVSQRFGIQIKRLKKFNHLDNDPRLTDGTFLWLNSDKPGDGGLNDTEPAIELEEEEVFDWSRPIDIEHNHDAKGRDRLQSFDKSQANPASTDRTHPVQQGETLYAIAKRYGLTVNDLKVLNGLADPLAIKPGQVLKVSVDKHVTNNGDLVGHPQDRSEGPFAGGVIHEVRASDTIYSVARLYGVTIKDLMDCNDKKDFAVSLGEKLKIPSR